MSDGQDKSDDLIAELAKLMASTAGGPEPEAKPGPKLITPPEAEAQRPAAPTFRIPGMDAPSVAPPTAAPTLNAERPATPAPTIRIPGMDQPVAAPQAAPRSLAPTAAPAPVAPNAVELKADVAPKAPAIDFGAIPPATTIRPEPMSNWQDREIPKPVASRPAMSSEPVLTPPVAVEPRVAAPAITATPTALVTAPMLTPPKPAERNVPARDLDSDEQMIEGRPAPEGDGFDFDFDFENAPPSVTPPAVAAAPAPTARSVPAVIPASDDPIADLIAAELDAAEAEEPTAQPVPARPPVQAPAVRSFQSNPQPAAPPAQQRAVTTNPVRPPVAPQAPAPQAKSLPIETDQFATAPVFGLGGRPSSPPPVERDPMDEIESLIGEAVRVELSAPEKPAAPERQQPAPIVPPLNSAFAPRRATLKDNEPQIASAEAAILAAAAAGAEVGRADAKVGRIAAAKVQPEPTTSYTRPKAKPERKKPLSSGMRQYVGMAVAGTLLLAAGFGLYWVLGMGRGNDAEAPVLTAEATPAKQPAPVTPPKEDAQGEVVFNTLDGTTAAAPTDEQLVSRDDSTDTSVADVAATVGDDAAATNESELANRKVRTVTVRPDGTVVSGDDAQAGAEALPIDRPNVPQVPGADTQQSELLAALPSNDTPAVTDPIAGAIDAAQTPTATPLAPGATIDPSIVAPIPAARPADRSVLGGGSNQRVAAVDTSGPVDLTGGDTAPVATPRAPATVSNAAGAYVQLSSQPSSGDAQSSLRTTQNRLSSILNGRSLEIRQVDLGAKGVWFRVVLPVNSFSEATQTCASFKANGTDCVAING